MRYLLTIILASFMFLGNAQKMTKKEKKALKKEIKKMKKDPSKYKFMKESLEAKEVIISEQNTELRSLKQENQQTQNRILSLKDSVSMFSTRLQEAEANANKGPDQSGTKYRVQIGLYEYLNLVSYIEPFKYLFYENVNGQSRYTLGNFSDVYDAESFKLEVMKMGIKDAFVSQYNNGERNMNFSTDNLQDMGSSNTNSSNSNFKVYEKDPQEDGNSNSEESSIKINGNY